MSNLLIRFDSKFSADSCVGLTTETILDSLQFNFGKIDNLDLFFLEDLELEILAGLTTISFRLQNFPN